MPPPEHVWIPAPDGIRLAATLHLPAGEGPWPAVLEALPYRKDDITASYRPEYEQLAEAGYVVCRLDVRGTGTSEGIAEDEYTRTERADLVAVIDWLATREWSTGAVGMYGTSYSGFNSLQIAMDGPPALKAICSIFASDDRYGDDVHYFGGVLKQLDVVDYPTYMVAMNALPPVPSLFGDGWREEWTRRVDGTEPWLLTWLEHQRYDAYWKHGSLREDYGAVRAATMLVAGWADGYTNIALRGFEELDCPKRLLLGPWSHANVETCLPGPNIELVPEMVRWWDRWLKGRDNGVDRDPPITLFAQRSTPPAADRREVRGTWRFEPAWPPERLVPTELELVNADAAGSARPGPGPDVLAVRGDVGATAWISCAGNLPWGQSTDQRPDEAQSLTYTWEALEDELEIWGHPRLRVRVASSEPVAYLGAKICDVFPDGTSSLVVRGLLNLAHRDSRENPTPLVPGQIYDVELELEACSWTFERGHRIRLDLAGADWPNAWAPPAAGKLSVDRDASRLVLPVLDGPPPVADAPALRLVAETRTAQPTPRTADGPTRDGVVWSVEEDVLARERRAATRYGGDYPAAGALPSMLDRYQGVVGVSQIDPGRAYARGEGEFEMRYPEGVCRTLATVAVESDPTAYRVTIELLVTEDGRERQRRTWDRTFPRDLQ
jgi:putative CocE/NonD family hydrolase